LSYPDYNTRGMRQVGSVLGAQLPDTFPHHLRRVHRDARLGGVGGRGLDLVAQAREVGLGAAKSLNEG
jgi:hypothetical protein